MHVYSSYVRFCFSVTTVFRALLHGKLQVWKRQFVMISLNENPFLACETSASFNERIDALNIYSDGPPRSAVFRRAGEQQNLRYRPSILSAELIGVVATVRSVCSIQSQRLRYSLRQASRQASASAWDGWTPVEKGAVSEAQ